MTASWTADAVYAGALRELEDDGGPTGIYKTPVAGPVHLGREGLAGDVQADRRHHGGPERALNHYPADHYPGWRERFPERAGAFAPGVLGENLSTRGLTEADVRVGDVFRLGDAVIQVSQPRNPCWKIGRRLGLRELPRAVVETGRAGWLYRVLEPGEIAPGDELTLEARAPHGITLARLWAVQGRHRPDAEARETMAELAALPELAPVWRQRFASRLAWLLRN